MRVLINSASSLSLTFYGDETSVAADGAVTVTVTDTAGTVVSTGPATLGASNLYTYALPAQAKLSKLTAVWSGTFSGNAQTVTTYVEVVGQRLFSLAELRASDSDLSSTANYPTSALTTARDEVEAEFERITRVSFLPRYRKVTLDGTGTMFQTVRDNYIRTIRSVTVAGYPTYTTQQLANVVGTEFGQIIDTSGGIFFVGTRNVVVEYEYGYDAPPADLKRAALLRARTRLTSNRGGVPDRATSFSAAEGGTYSLATAGRAGYQTGIPDVDAVLMQYSLRTPGIG